MSVCSNTPSRHVQTLTHDFCVSWKSCLALPFDYPLTLRAHYAITDLTYVVQTPIVKVHLMVIIKQFIRLDVVGCDGNKKACLLKRLLARLSHHLFLSRHNKNRLNQGWQRPSTRSNARPGNVGWLQDYGCSYNGCSYNSCKWSYTVEYSTNLPSWVWKSGHNHGRCQPWLSLFSF